MNIPKEQIVKKRPIGKRGNDTVWMVTLMGGLNLCVIGSSHPEIAAVSPHPAVSRHLAQKKFPDMHLDIQKNEDFNLDGLDDLIKKYENLTDALINIQNG